MPLTTSDRVRLYHALAHDAVATFPQVVADAHDRLGATAPGLYRAIADGERRTPRVSMGWERLRAAHTAIATEYHLPVAVWLQALRGDDALAGSLDRLVDLCLAQWGALDPARWTPARVAFVIQVMSGAEPRMPARLRTAWRAAWDDGVRGRGLALAATLPSTARVALTAAMGGPAGGKTIETAAQGIVPLTEAAEIAQLGEADWGHVALATCQQVIARCQLRRGLPALTDLVQSMLWSRPQDGVVLARDVVRAQTTLDGLDHVLEAVASAGRYEVVTRDVGFMDAVCDRVAVASAAEAHTAPVSKCVAEAALMVPPPRWVPAITRLLTSPAGRGKGREHVLRVIPRWWSSHPTASTSVHPEVLAALTAACLAAPEAELRTWAMTALTAPPPVTTRRPRRSARAAAER